MSEPWVVAWYAGHDASVALVSPERIVHLEKERFTRIRHDGGDVDSLFPIALEQAGMSADDLVATARVAPDGDGKCWATDSPLEVECTERTVLGRTLPHYYLPHHLAHAAYAFYTSPFARAAVVTMDGGGDGRMISGGSAMNDGLSGWAEHRFGEGRGAWTLHYATEPSIGHEWNRLASELFGDGGTYSAGKVMAVGGVAAATFEEQTGFPIAVREQIQQLQQRTNKAIIAAVARHVSPHEQYNLVLGGGIMLNGLAVAALLDSQVAPRQIQVPPAINDSGLSVGAALYVLHALLQTPRHVFSPAALAFCGYHEPALDERPDIGAIVSALLARQTVALVHGPAESGPRALGHRSLIGVPSRQMKARLNAMKGRAAWRPCAPVVHVDDAPHWFQLTAADAYRFMTCICTHLTYGAAVPAAALHDDGSARVQMVDDFSLLGAILSALREEVGMPMMLLNTSLNAAGEAMPNTRAQALDTCQRLGVDVAFLGSEVVAT